MQGNKTGEDKLGKQEPVGAGGGPLHVPSECCLCAVAHLAEASPGVLKSANLKPFLNEVQGVSKGLADDSSSRATKQVFQVS